MMFGAGSTQLSSDLSFSSWCSALCPLIIKRERERESENWHVNNETRYIHFCPIRLFAASTVQSCHWRGLNYERKYGDRLIQYSQRFQSGAEFLAIKEWQIWQLVLNGEEMRAFLVFTLWAAIQKWNIMSLELAQISLNSPLVVPFNYG